MTTERAPLSLRPTDIAALTAYLDAPYPEIAREVREQLAASAELLDLETTETPTEFREQVLKQLLVMAEGGHTGLGYPIEYGGGGDVGASITAFQNLAYGDLSLLVKAGVQFGLFGGAILHLGTRRHHDAYLADVISGRVLGCFAMSETGHGSNVQEVETTATYDPETDELVIRTPSPAARKDYIGNAAAHGHLAVVFAQLDVDGERHGVHAIVVPIRTPSGEPVPGVTITDCGPKLGLKGVDNGRLEFDDVRVPRDHLLNRYADITERGEYRSPIDNPDRRFFTMLGTLVQGRVSIGGAGVYASRVALAIAIRYANRRRQFGPADAPEATLMSYRTHQRRLLPALARTYALSASQREVSAMLHESFSSADVIEEDRRLLESRAAGQKALATWHASETIQACREACGGAGYLADNRFAALRADTDVFTTFEGDNTVLLQLVAKGLLTQFKQSFNDLDPLGTLRFVTNQAVGTVVERTALRPLVERLRVAGRSKDHAAVLLDPQYQRALYHWREEHIRTGLARRLKQGIDAGRPAFDVFAECQDHVVEMARAHVQRLVFEAFDASVADADEAVRPVLRRLCHLHALAELEAERGWYLEHGRLSAERSKALTSAVGRLCAELTPFAEGLTDGFAVPEALLRAPISVRS